MELSFGLGGLTRGKLYKVIQITINGAPQLIFAEHTGGIFHSAILKKVLRVLDIPYTEIHVGCGFGPDTSGSGYMVNGMGGAQLLSQNRVKFFGGSSGYGFKISDAHLDWFREEYPDWTLIAEYPHS